MKNQVHRTGAAQSPENQLRRPENQLRGINDEQLFREYEQQLMTLAELFIMRRGLLKQFRAFRKSFTGDADEQHEAYLCAWEGIRAISGSIAEWSDDDVTRIATFCEANGGQAVLFPADMENDISDVLVKSARTGGGFSVSWNQFGRRHLLHFPAGENPYKGMKHRHSEEMTWG